MTKKHLRVNGQGDKHWMAAFYDEDRPARRRILMYRLDGPAQILRAGFNFWLGKERLGKRYVLMK